MADTRAKRSALRGKEQRLFNLVFMRATSRQLGNWLAAPLECSVVAGDLATTIAVLKAGAIPFGQEGTERLSELLLAHCDHRDVIHVACLFEHDTLMEKLLRNRNAKDISPEQLAAYVRLAIEHSSFSAVGALLAAGADYALRHPEDGCAALDVATINGDLKIIALLLTAMAGALDVNSACHRGYTALHRATHYDQPEAIELLLEAGANVDPRDRSGWTPLFDACAEGSMDAIVALLRHGADRWHLASGRGLLHVAAERGHLPAVMALLHHGRRDVEHRYGDSECSPLNFAVIAGHEGVARALVEAGGANVNDSSSDDRTALHRAAFFNRATAIDELFWAGADLDAETNIDCFRRTPIFDAAAAGSTEAVLTLLGHGASVHALDVGGRTALHAAIEADHTASCSALLAGGANPFLRHGDGQVSVLDVAVREGNLDTVDAIIQSCAAGLLGSADAEGCTALHNAAQAGEVPVVEALLEAGAAVDPRDETGWTPLFAACAACSSDAVAVLLQCGANVNALDVESRSPLYLSAQLGFAGPAGLLLAAGADVSRRFGKSECSALDLAVLEGHVEVVEAMIAHGADVGAADRSGRTAAHRACFFDQHVALAVLVERGGASVSVEDRHGRTPLDVATARGSKGAAMLLSTLSADTAPPSPPGPDPAAGNTNSSGGGGSSSSSSSSRELEFNTASSGEAGRAFEASPAAPNINVRFDEDDNDDDDDGSPDRSPHEYAELLAKRPSEAAPTDQAWDRRRSLILCRARFARLRLLRPRGEGVDNPGCCVVAESGGAGVEGHAAGAAVGGEEGSAKARPLPGRRLCAGEEGGSKARPLRAAAGRGDDAAAAVAVAAAGVMGRVVLLEEDGLFRSIVGFL